MKDADAFFIGMAIEEEENLNRDNLQPMINKLQPMINENFGVSIKLHTEAQDGEHRLMSHINRLSLDCELL